MKRARKIVDNKGNFVQNVVYENWQPIAGYWRMEKYPKSEFGRYLKCLSCQSKAIVVKNLLANVGYAYVRKNLPENLWFTPPVSFTY